MRLLLDEMLDAEIARQLTRRGWDVEAIQGNAALEGKIDREVLALAARAGQIVVTDNVTDFSLLHRDWLAAGEHHRGILFAASGRFPRSKRTLGLWIEALECFLQEAGEGALADGCQWLRPVPTSDR